MSGPAKTKSRRRAGAGSAGDTLRSSRSEAGPQTLTPQATTSLGNWSGYGSNGHTAADFSRQRGYLYFPQLDTRKEISPQTRTEVMRKSRWFCCNHGLPRRIVFGLSRLAAGTGLTPHPLTADRDWNKEALAYAGNRFDSPLTYDVGGRFDFYSAQAFSLAAHYRDGDQPTIQTESATGQAMFAHYEGHQVGNGSAATFGAPATTDYDRWHDGVKTDRNGRAIAYRFLDDEGHPTEVDAAHVMLLADYERASQVRSTSILEHAVNHLHDATDIASFIKTGVKLTNLYGYWIERGAGASSGGPSPFGSAVHGATTTVDAGRGDGSRITLEQVIGGGVIPELNAGESLKFNDAMHPHPNQLNFLDYLIRDIAWGVGVAPDLLWNIAALGGANTRFVLADAQSWIEKEQEKLIRLKLQREWTYTIAKGMASGQLRRCPDPQWWKVGWIPPPRLTVDFGRDGRLYIEQNRSAMLTLKTVFGWQGQDWEPQLDQWLDEMAYLKKGLNDRGLTWDDVQQYRSSTGNRPDPLASAASSPDGAPTDPVQAGAFLAELQTNPAAARGFMAQLQNLAT